MKVYGEMLLNGTSSKLKGACLGLVPDFPDIPRVGQLVFKDKKLYICTEFNATPIWFPLTTDLAMYTANFSGSDVWTCVHGLDNDEILIQIYDTDNYVIYPNEVDNSVIGRTTIRFSTAMSGRIFIVQRLANADRIVVYVKDEQGNYVVDSYGNYLIIQ